MREEKSKVKRNTVGSGDSPKSRLPNELGVSKSTARGMWITGTEVFSEMTRWTYRLGAQISSSTFMTGSQGSGKSLSSQNP